MDIMGYYYVIINMIVEGSLEKKVGMRKKQVVQSENKTFVMSCSSCVSTYSFGNILCITVSCNLIAVHRLTH